MWRLASTGAVAASTMGTANAFWAASSKPGVESTSTDKEHRPEMITRDQIELFHRIKSQLRDIKSLHHAMAVSGVQWNFRESKAQPGRIWTDETPPELQELVDRELEPVSACVGTRIRPVP